MPIIGITARAEVSSRKQMLEAGAVGFLSKPFDDECLINCLTTALEKRQQLILAIKQRRHPFNLAVGGASAPTGSHSTKKLRRLVSGLME